MRLVPPWFTFSTSKICNILGNLGHMQKTSFDRDIGMLITCHDSPAGQPGILNGHTNVSRQGSVLSPGECLSVSIELLVVSDGTSISTKCSSSTDWLGLAGLENRVPLSDTKRLQGHRNAFPLVSMVRCPVSVIYS